MTWAAKLTSVAQERDGAAQVCADWREYADVSGAVSVSQHPDRARLVRLGPPVLAHELDWSQFPLPCWNLVERTRVGVIDVQISGTRLFSQWVGNKRDDGPNDEP